MVGVDVVTWLRRLFLAGFAAAGGWVVGGLLMAGVGWVAHQVDRRQKGWPR